MNYGPQLLLIGAVAAVGVLHTIVPDHWVPITLVARQQGWTKAQTARASLKAGTGHVLSTLAIALIVWGAGVAFAEKFGQYVDTAASLALVGFGGWIAISSLMQMRSAAGHSHGHTHNHAAWIGGNSVHGPELQVIKTDHGDVSVSIFEKDMPPHFRVTGVDHDTMRMETIREDGKPQVFTMVNRGSYWESKEPIPEPHQFRVSLVIEHGAHGHTYQIEFAEHAHGHGGHSHDEIDSASGKPKISSNTALLLILGSSPMVEGIPAFFAASKYGIPLIVIMSLVFGITTILTYLVLCVYSTAGLQRVSFGPLERYGEVISGAFIAIVGVAFWLWPATL